MSKPLENTFIQPHNYIAMRQRAERAEAENARLQERVEELVKAMLPHARGPLGEPFFKTKADAERALEQVEKASDGYKAQAERLQDGYDSLKCQYDEEHDELLHLQARVEEAEESVEQWQTWTGEVQQTMVGYKARDKLRGEALTGLMPLMDDGECCYCSWGSQVQEDGHHFDADNIWDGDPICLNDSHYDDARDATAMTPEEALKRKPL